MKEFIKRIKRGLRGLFNYLAWNRQYKDIILNPRKSNFVSNRDWYVGHKILLMVPHADDELISSYSILSNTTDVTIYYCGFTGSNHTEENRLIREREILNLCSELEVNVIIGDRICGNVEGVLKEGGYDIILLPSIVDWHPEHRKLSYMISDACVRLGIAPDIYNYSVTVPNESRREVLCVPLTESQLRKKYELFKKIYLSQKVMPITRLKLNERINGYNAGCYAAETFLKYNFDSWSKMVKKVKAIESVQDSRVLILINTLKESINDLVSVRCISNELYFILETNSRVK